MTERMKYLWNCQDYTHQFINKNCTNPLNFMCYNLVKSSRIIARGKLLRCEESPCIQGQTAGETPGSVSWRIGPQKGVVSTQKTADGLISQAMVQR